MDPINGCDEPPVWVVLGWQMMADYEIVPLVLACCEAHRQAVEAYQDAGFEQVRRYPVHLAGELVMALAGSGDVYVGAAVPA